MVNVINNISRRYFATIIFLLLSIVTSINAFGFVLVIDAGHGGKDIGAPGLITTEKVINLAVAKSFGELVKDNCDDVKVVYTRKKDIFVTLQGRADIANRVKADLFVSIHTNSVDEKSKNRTTVHGAATYVLGLHRSEENMKVAMRENAVIQLEDDATEKYRDFDPNSAESYIIFELTQKQNLKNSIDYATLAQQQMTKVAGRANHGVRQAGFYVLAKTGMPAVLVELGFICNPEEEEYLASEQGVEELAQSLFNAFMTYKEAIDKKHNKANHKN